MAERRNDKDQSEELEEALQPEHRPDLLGQTEENRNLTGSTTWETLDEEDREAKPRSDRGADAEQRGQEAKRSKHSRASSPNPPRTTKDGITAPKFGSAGSGGAELEPGPEGD